MSLPLLVSVPHAGTEIPPEVESLCALNLEQIVRDGDEGAGEIYAIESSVGSFVTSKIARAFVDLNRAPTDIRSDGVVKTETIYQESIYRQPLDERTIAALLQKYYHPYHAELSRLSPLVRLGIDCHTMAAFAPPISDNAGTERPLICLSHANHTCPEDWFEGLATCLETSYGFAVARNEPFQGGHIIRAHCHEIPWVQLEISRAPFMPLPEQRERLLEALGSWCRQTNND